MAGLSFFSIEDASEGGLDAEHREKVGGGMNGSEAFGGLGGRAEIESFPVEGGQKTERMILFAEIEKIGAGVGQSLRLGRRAVNANEPARIRIRPAREQGRVQQTEH
jgi:hypothetical protein